MPAARQPKALTVIINEDPPNLWDVATQVGGAGGRQLLPVVQNIHGDDSLSPQTGGVAAINKRAATATPVVQGIQSDLAGISVF